MKKILVIIGAVVIATGGLLAWVFGINKAEETILDM